MHERYPACRESVYNLQLIPIRTKYILELRHNLRAGMESNHHERKIYHPGRDNISPL